MKIQHIRNATMIIHSKEHRILIDPCLNPKGSLPPYTLIRKMPRLNPVVDLPPNAQPLLQQITSGLITHCRYGHFDHLDGTGTRLLAQKQVPVYCNSPDAPFLRRRNIKAIPLALNQKSGFLNGSITTFPTAHGIGFAGFLMRPGAGYFIELPDDKTIYISGDTVMTPVVRQVLREHRPDISVINAGTAVLDFGRPILMTLHEQMEFIKSAPGKVIAVHLDAFNHCLTTRALLRDAVAKEGLSGKVLIPEDGELLEI
jgi:L-ascorbate metabolism protein UlaG (beta-lactamase superfamily)